MRIPMFCLLLAALAGPAYAGHGTIEETDEAIIVEYSGDAGEKPADGKPSIPAYAVPAPIANFATPERPPMQTPPGFQMPDLPAGDAGAEVARARSQRPARRVTGVLPP